MYQLTEIEKHNLEMNVLNAAMNIQHLLNCVRVFDLEFDPKSTQDTLLQLQNAQRTLDNLTPIVSEWKDEEADVHKS